MTCYVSHVCIYVLHDLLPLENTEHFPNRCKHICVHVYCAYMYMYMYMLKQYMYVYVYACTLLYMYVARP